MSSSISTYERQLEREIHDTPKEYLPNLLQLVRLFRASVMLNPAEVSFQKGWAGAMMGQVSPISDLWQDIDAE